MRAREIFTNKPLQFCRGFFSSIKAGSCKNLDGYKYSSYNEYVNNETLVELDINKRDKFITQLKEKGLSIRQICRLTGVSFSVIRKL